MAESTKMCPHCKGCKEIMGMGFMTRKCEHCKGVGYLAIEERPSVVAITEALNITPKKSAGRPKSNKSLELGA